MDPRPRALVVDDEPAIRVVVRDMLEFMGVTADLARDGTEGLAMLRQSEYAFIITDFMMPRMSGLEVAAAVRREHPGLPLAILTGSVIPAVIEQFRAQGFRVLGKPISLAELTTAVEALLAESRRRSQEMSADR